jgi:hypothetical protein
VTIAAAAQNGRLLFTGKAGQTVDVTMSAATSFTANWTLTVVSPTGTVIGGPMTPSGVTQQTTAAIVLPQTGTYTVLVDPVAATVGTVFVSVRNLSATAPSITTFSPQTGAPGTLVSISGGRT